MFTASQLAYLRALAQESAGNVTITFDRRRLLLKTGYVDDDYAGILLFLCFAGIFALLGLFIGCKLPSWGLVAGSCAALGALVWGGRRVLASRTSNLERPPNFVFDVGLQSFFVLAPSPAPAAAPQYERYPSRLLTDTRVVILSSNQYSDDTVLELRFGAGNWVRALRVTNTPVAYAIERAIKACQRFAAD